MTGMQNTIDGGDAAWNVRLDSSSGDMDYDGVGDVEE